MPAFVSRGGGGRGRRAINEINMVPFIDVMLVLLIIFMVTAPLISPSLVDLPSVGKARATPPRIVQVLIARDGSLTWRADAASGEPQNIALASLAQAVKTSQGAAGPQVPVVIAADKTVKYEAVVQVMDVLQRAGVPRVGLAVQTTP